MKDLIATLHGREEGQTTLESGLILVFVSTAMIAALLMLFGGVTGYYSSLTDAISKI